jgi:F-type H+-transporting ATPase subunit delta
MIDSQNNKARTSTAVNVGAQRVAAVYAKALLGAAEAAGKTDDAVEELNTFITAALDAFPDLEAVLASALVAYEDKAKLLDRAFGQRLSPLVLNFLKVVARHGRLDIVRAIAAEVAKLYDQLRGRVRVQLSTAAPLGERFSHNLAANLHKLLGAQPEIESAVDPELIGGIVLRVGDTVYDGSLARQLDQVREQMITRSVHEIQSRRDRFRHSGGN